MKKLIYCNKFEVAKKTAEVRSHLTLINNVFFELTKLGVIPIEQPTQIQECIRLGGQGYVINEIQKKSQGTEVNGFKLDAKRFAESVDIGNPSALNNACDQAQNAQYSIRYFDFKAGKGFSLPERALDLIKEEASQFTQSEDQAQLLEAFQLAARAFNTLNDSMKKTRGYGIHPTNSISLFFNVPDFNNPEGVIEARPEWWELNKADLQKQLQAKAVR